MVDGIAKALAKPQLYIQFKRNYMGFIRLAMAMLRPSGKGRPAQNLACIAHTPYVMV